MTRAVLDTNVFVSTFLIPGRLNRLADLIVQKSFLWLISEEIFEEYAAVASRSLFKLAPEEVASLLYQIKERTEWVFVRHSVSVVAEDPADDKFLGCAVDGRADCVVTGDHHLLKLKGFRGVKIMTPAEFLKITLKGNA